METLTEQELARPITELMRDVETALVDTMTVGEAMVSLHDRPIEHKIFYLYVVDDAGRLVGVLPLRTLLMGDAEQKIGELMMKPVLSLRSDATLQIAIETFAIHRLLALPVVDAEQRLVGLVDIRLYSDELYMMAEHDREVDLFQIIGVSVASAREGGAWRGFAMRMPWLACNLVGGVACAMIAAFFDLVLSQVLLLAMFIPLVLTLAESISIQALTLSLQHLHGSGGSWKRVRAHLLGEWQTAAMLGLANGVLVGIAALLWRYGIHPPLVIALSISLSMVIAATLGTLAPSALRYLKLDPKIAAGPIVLMLTDVATLSLYLSLATWWLSPGGAGG